MVGFCVGAASTEGAEGIFPQLFAGSTVAAAESGVRIAAVAAPLCGAAGAIGTTPYCPSGDKQLHPGIGVITYHNPVIRGIQNIALMSGGVHPPGHNNLWGILSLGDILPTATITIRDHSGTAILSVRAGMRKFCLKLPCPQVRRILNIVHIDQRSRPHLGPFLVDDFKDPLDVIGGIPWHLHCHRNCRCRLRKSLFRGGDGDGSVGGFIWRGYGSPLPAKLTVKVAGGAHLQRGILGGGVNGEAPRFTGLQIQVGGAGPKGNLPCLGRHRQGDIGGGGGVARLGGGDGDGGAAGGEGGNCKDAPGIAAIGNASPAADGYLSAGGICSDAHPLALADEPGQGAVPQGDRHRLVGGDGDGDPLEVIRQPLLPGGGRKDSGAGGDSLYRKGVPYPLHLHQLLGVVQQQLCPRPQGDGQGDAPLHPHRGGALAAVEGKGRLGGGHLKFVFQTKGLEPLAAYIQVQLGNSYRLGGDGKLLLHQAEGDVFVILPELHLGLLRQSGQGEAVAALPLLQGGGVQQEALRLRGDKQRRKAHLYLHRQGDGAPIGMGSLQGKGAASHLQAGDSQISLRMEANLCGRLPFRGRQGVDRFLRSLQQESAGGGHREGQLPVLISDGRVQGRLRLLLHRDGVRQDSLLRGLRLRLLLPRLGQQPAGDGQGQGGGGDGHLQGHHTVPVALPAAGDGNLLRPFRGSGEDELLVPHHGGHQVVGACRLLHLAAGGSRKGQGQGLPRRHFQGNMHPIRLLAGFQRKVLPGEFQGTGGGLLGGFRLWGWRVTAWQKSQRCRQYKRKHLFHVLFSPFTFHFS